EIFVRALLVFNVLIFVEVLVFGHFFVLIAVGRLTKLDGFRPGECPELHVKAPPQGGANTVEMLAGIITNGLWCLAPFDPAFCGTISRVLGASFLSGGVAQRQSRGLISPVSEVQFLPPPPHLHSRIFPNVPENVPTRCVARSDVPIV